MRVEGNIAFDIHAFGKGILLVTGVERHPRIAWAGNCPAARVVVHIGFNPHMLDADRLDHTTRGQPDIGNTALAQYLLRRIRRLRATNPVHHLVSRQIHRAIYIAGGNAAGAQQAYQQTGLIEGVAALFVQRVLRALRTAITGEERNIVVHPVEDCDRVLAQIDSLLLDIGGERCIDRGGKVGRAWRRRRGECRRGSGLNSALCHCGRSLGRRCGLRRRCRSWCSQERPQLIGIVNRLARVGLLHLPGQIVMVYEVGAMLGHFLLQESEQRALRTDTS